MVQFAVCDNCGNEFENVIYETEYNAFGREHRLNPLSWVHHFLCLTCFMDWGNNKPYSLGKFKKWNLTTQNF